MSDLREQVLAIPTAGQNPSWVKAQALALIDAHEDRIAGECYAHEIAAVNAALGKVLDAIVAVYEEME